MSSTDWRALCEELAGWIERATRHYIHDPEVLIRARAALAQPEPEVVGPTARELKQIFDDQSGYIGDEQVMWHGDFAAAARAVLARWGRPAPVPAGGADCPACEGVPKPGNQPCAVCGRSALSAEGEVAELAWWLRSLEDASVWFESGSPEALKLTRAADLLEQRQAAPVPVAMSERLPQAKDCDAEGRVWLYRPQTPILNPYWDLVKLDYIDIDPVQPTHWLPANALPLPSGEVV